jgi:hypothetical protein
MKNRAARPPSPAMVVALIALFVALGGTGYAASQLTSSPTAVTAKTGKKSKKKPTKPLRGPIGPRGPTGAAGPQGKEGVPGKEGSAGKDGKEGPAGSALAYAHVNADGTVDPNRSKNITSANVEQIPGGAYCFHGLPFTPKNVVASLTNFTLGFITVGVPPDVGSVCAPGVQVRVETWNDEAPPKVTNEAFEIMLN